ncbi:MULTISPECIES: RICIN domain-containing protein [unclassified Symbiopectobacterium]|uniref:RICIN domain-containing protein n=1 Tax=unclassified Symbiopectobacterium TaxID=2794573 RepID=UPI002227C04E|nr:MULTISPECIES: RICIN domain-containing protein [unclassified Symbiopectobacterium]MCW2473746.1 RICIN domain-containing protein [Candidatus Symbiopectobacterium sp. NZEC151]MCW2484998.1 RICIN domain-containing protein [Candidatus Symbiopectobacterium sp. NZEC127]
MKNAKVCSRLAVVLALMVSSASLMAAEKSTIREQDLAQAFVITLNATTVNGFVSIARGRNCVVQGANGIPTLLTCPEASKTAPVTTAFKIIELSHDECLADDGMGPVVKRCDIKDPAQHWDALTAGPTHVKNFETKRCLTSVGLDKPLKLQSCTGSFAQTWVLPQ